MQKLSLVQQIIIFLKEHTNQSFTAREIAYGLIKSYRKHYEQKKQNSQQHFSTDEDFVSQVVSEIGACKNQLNRADIGIYIQDQPRPRTYQWKGKADFNVAFVDSVMDEDDNYQEQNLTVIPQKKKLTEFDLYPLLIKYLVQEHHLWCDTINEKHSRKDKGKNANKWLHPDVVAMQPVTEAWHPLIKTCVQEGGGKLAYLWSFEVKRQIKRSTVREYFFQAVSNSSWANYGYLVCETIADDGSMGELRMLSALHGIGIIVLKTDNITESEIIIPALFKEEVDWCSVNRLINENADMKNFIHKVAGYFRSALLQKDGWNQACS